MTSPFSALRFSGRLMVIQKAWPRFSVTTLLSVIALLARLSPRKPIYGDNGRNSKQDRNRESPRSGYLMSINGLGTQPSGNPRVAIEPRKPGKCGATKALLLRMRMRRLYVKSRG